MGNELAVWLIFLGVASCSLRARGDDLYVIRMASGVRFAGPPCLFISWRDDIRFYGTGVEPQVVTLLGVSNAAMRQSPAAVVVAPGALVSTLGVGGPGDSWTPVGNPSLWVAHLDVPAGVLVDSQGEAITRGTNPDSCNPTDTEFVHGSFPLPQFRSLTPANTAQVHLVADLGTEDARLNVGIYNAGPVPAHVSVDVRRSCNSSTLTHRDLTVTANSVEQTAGILIGDFLGCGGLGTAPDYAMHLVVLSDQPGFSYVTALSNQLPPVMPLTMSR